MRPKSNRGVSGEARRAESGDGDLGERVASRSSPLPPAKGAVRERKLRGEA